MNITDIIGKKIAVHIQTRDEALKFLGLLDEAHIVHTNSGFWTENMGNTCCILSADLGISKCYGHIDAYKRDGYTIIPLNELSSMSLVDCNPQGSVTSSLLRMEPGKAYYIDYGGTQVIGRYISSDTTQHYFHGYLHYWAGHENFKTMGYCVKSGIQSIRRASPAEIHNLVRFEIDNGTI